ncbi:MAG: hypothetical protein ABJA57_02065 [Ginsengibacter sp.]
MKPLQNFFYGLKLMPVLIFHLFVVQFFTWFGLFALWIYATPAITRYIFKTTDAGSGNFESGIMWVGYCFAFYSLFAAFLSFFIPMANRKFGILRVHAFSLLVGSAGLLALFAVHNKWALFIPFACIGIGWSSISNIPYKIVASLAGETKIDFFMSVFGFSVVIPQILAATMLGYITIHLLNNNTLYTILFGGASMMVASAIMFMISLNGDSGKDEVLPLNDSTTEKGQEGY